MKKAVIYARVSTDEQAERGTSIQAQSEKCHEYAKENGLEVVKEYKEDYTGTTLDRPELNQLQDDLKNGLAIAVIVFCTDRLSRNYPDSVLLKSIWADQDIELHLTDTGKEDFSFESMIIGAFKQITAHHEIDTLIRRSKRGKNDKILKLGKPVVQGIPPYGYRIKGRNHKAEYHIYEPEARFVKIMFDLYTKGDGTSKPYSLRGLAKYLSDIGAPTPTHLKRRAKEWLPSTIQRILSNEKYKGEYIWGKTRMEKRGFQQKGNRLIQPESEWLRLDISELAIVNPKTWEVAQMRLEKNKKLSKRNRKRQYLLVGHIRCSSCGFAFHGNFTKKNGKEHRYYRHRYKASTYQCDSQKSNIPIAILDPIVWDWLVDLLTDEALLLSGLNEVSDLKADQFQENKFRLEAITDLMKETQEEINHYIVELPNHSSEIAITGFRTKIDQLSKQYETLSLEHNNIVHELAQSDISDNEEKHILEFAKQISLGLETATYSDKRQLLDLLDVKIEYNVEEDGEWVSVLCAIPTMDTAIELQPSR